VFGNHWPFRSGGRWESAGYRGIAGETLGFFHERVLEVHGPTTPVLAMGDFNDEPFDTSLVTHAGSTRQHDKVVNARSALLWNLMWPVMGTGHEAEADGTFYFDNEPNLLDQFLINKHMATNTGAHPGTGRHSRNHPLPRHGLGRGLPQADPVERHGQTHQRRRLLRPLPHRPPNRGS
jgi:Endonuclease/Exonuclease/phosphatase family